MFKIHFTTARIYRGINFYVSSFETTIIQYQYPHKMLYPLIFNLN